MPTSGISPLESTLMIDKDRITKAKLDIIQVTERIDSLIGKGLDSYLSDEKAPLALKYLLIEAVEAISDICQHLLAKTKGIACLGYVDCIVKAGQEGIITSALSERLRRLADLRNIIIHRYWVIDDQKIFQETIENKRELADFVGQIEAFLASL